MQSVRSSPGSFSIIVPVLNEAKLIGSFLRHLRVVAPGAEIIVIDGGSSDGTARIAEALASVMISAPRSRALQMNAGADLAQGEVLWFLHADLQVPGGALGDIERALHNPHVAGGCFRLRFPQPELIYRVSDLLGNLGVEVFGFALGDHGIFCRRAHFQQIGGYPDVPILEDAEIYRRLRRTGRMVQLRAEVLSSPRAYQLHGPYRTTAVYMMILALYVLGAPMFWLARIYRNFRGRNDASVEQAVLAHASK